MKRKTTMRTGRGADNLPAVAVFYSVTSYGSNY